MSSDNQFTAIGEAEVGFQTNSASIKVGADIAGNEVGGRFRCELGNAIEAFSNPDGLSAGNAAGVLGRGDIGVRGSGRGFGVFGRGFDGGVIGVREFIAAETGIPVGPAVAGMHTRIPEGEGEDDPSHYNSLLFDLLFRTLRGNGAGVFGFSDAGGDGVIGLTDLLGKSGVAGFNDSGTGVFGHSKAATGVNGDSETGIGVDGSSRSNSGVRGHSVQNDGVAGVSDANGKSGVFGFNSKKEGAAFGVVGQCDSPGGSGVGGGSGPGVGVQGHSQGNNGVVGRSKATGKSGVFGENDAKPGLIGGHGEAVASGVTGKSKHSVGVLGISENETGISGRGDTYGGVFQGNRAPLRLVPSLSEGPPKSGQHAKGEFFVASEGSLFFCIANGFPGTWKRVQLVDP